MRYLILFLVFCSPLSAGVYSFTGVGGGAIPDGTDPTPEVAPGTPLAFIFNVSGVTGTITSVALVMTINHTWSGDVCVALGSPTTVSPIFCRPGAATSSDYGYEAELAGVYTFSDGTNSNFWNMALAAGTGTIPTGNDYNASTPGGQSGGGVSVDIASYFSGLSDAEKNGVWTLLIQDATQGDTGTATFASIIISTTTGGGGGGGGGDDDDDGGCVTGSQSSSGAVLILGAFLYAVRRRRRRAC